MSKLDAPVYTECQLQNRVGNGCYLKLDSQHSWHGTGEPPETIQDKNDGNFKHNADDAGSIGGIVYVLVVDNADILKWITAWSNPEEKPNKVYTQIIAADANVDWDLIKSELNDSGHEYSVHNIYTYSSETVIDEYSPTPTLISKLRKAE